MGSLKEKYLQTQESRHQNLARALDISWGELANLEFEVITNTSIDGLVYGYTIVFDENSDESLLNKIRGLEANFSVHLDPWIFDRTEDEEYELSAIAENTNYKDNFIKEINTIEKLYELKIEDESLRKAHLRQLFVSVIGAIETYLYDAFIHRALSSNYHLEKFVNSHPEFKKEKIQISEIFSTSRAIKEKAKTVMLNTIYHKLPVVKQMYEATFDIKFPEISKMQQYVIQRHDLVHRNGKTKDGKVLIISEPMIEELIRSAIQFIENVDKSTDEYDIPF